jgi:glycerol-3-phosphate dehydrogenase (NAD(P)+)
MSMVAEGYYATKSAFEIKEKNGAKTPIIDAVFNVLYNKKEAKDQFEKLTHKLN